MTRKALIHRMTLEAWEAGIIVLAVLAAFETFERGFVSRVFNLNWLILFILAAAFSAMATHPPSHEATAGRRERIPWLQIVGVLSAIAAWVLLPPDLALKWRIAASLGLLLAALSLWTLLKDE